MEGLERWQNNQVKKMGIGRLGLIFFMIGGMLFVVLRSGQTTYLVIQVVLLLVHFFSDIGLDREQVQLLEV